MVSFGDALVVLGRSLRREYSEVGLTVIKSPNKVQLQRRDDIVRAALDLFGEHGVEATRMIDIANRAGIGKGTLYLHFPTKDALFEGVIGNTLLPAVAHVAQTTDSASGSALEQLRTQLKLMSERLSVGDMNTALRLIVTEGLKYPTVRSFYFKEVVGRGAQMIKKTIERGVETGEFTSQAAECHPIVFAGPTFMTAIWTMLFDEIEPVQREAILDAQFKLLTSGLLGQTP